MAISSADPDRLDRFADAAPAGRAPAEVAARRGSVLADRVIAACRGRGVSLTNFPAVLELLDQMAGNERFVRSVAEALRLADTADGRPAPTTTIDERIADHLAAVGVAAAPRVAIRDAALLGAPPTSGFVDDPICAATGNFVHTETDLAFPGTSASLDIDRWYNSLAADRVGAFGAGWTSVFDVVVLGLDDAHDGGAARSVTVRLDDGAQVELRRQPDATRWRCGSRRGLRLHAADDGWELSTGPGGRRWRFDRGGVLRGWSQPGSEVSAERDAGRRVVALVERRSSRRIDVEWRDGRVAALHTDDGRRAVYRYGECDTLERVETRSGALDHDHDGRLLISVTDPDGVSPFVNRYDARGRVVEQTSAFGRVTAYRYELAGTTVISDGSGVRQAMVHDTRGNLTAVVDADGSAMRLDYDHLDRVVRVVSRSGAEWRHDYDPAGGDLVRRRDPDGRGQSWTWDEHGRKRSETDRNGATTTFHYDGRLHVPSRVVGPDGATARARRNEWGEPTEVVDPDGVVTRFGWDRDGQLASITDALDQTTTFEYDASGAPTRIVEPDGTATELDRDGGGRVVATRRAGAPSTNRYTPAGRIAGGTDPGRGAWSASFGSHGAVETLIDAVGATTRYRYDPLGNVIEVVTADGARYVQEFDGVGRLVAFTDPATTTRLRHDREGNVVERRDGAGRTVRRTVDPFGRTLSSTAPDGTVTSWTHHGTGGIATTTLPDGRGWSTELDAAGRVAAVIDPTGERTSRVYSAAGRLLGVTDGAGRTRRFGYDAAGRCVAVVEPNGAHRSVRLDGRCRVIGIDVRRADGGAASVRVRRDAAGRVVAVGDRLGETRFERDVAGRVVTRVDPTGVTTRWRYDPRGLPVEVIDPAGATASYRFDVRGRPIAQTVPGGRTTTWHLDPAGRVETATDPAGVATEWLRDASGVVTAVRRGEMGWARALDEVGREIERRTLTGTPLDRPDGTARRWVRSTRPDGRTETHSWAGVDPVPPVSGGADADDAAVDAAGRLLAGADGGRFRYDAAGRLIECAPAVGEATRFEYGDDGLIAVERGPDGVRTFTYDAAGRAATVALDGGGIVSIAYDGGGRRTFERHPDGSMVEFGWQSVDRLVGIRLTEPDGATTTVDIGVTAPDATEATADARPALGRFRLVGARVLDELTHQFLSPDPVPTVPGSNGAASAYTYAWHDPVNHLDPSGLRPISIEEYRAIREREERGRLGQAWRAIEDDPWGTVATVGLVGAAVAIGGPVGMGIAVGLTTTAGVGFATGRLDPTQVAIGGAIAGIGLGGAAAVGSITASTTGTLAGGALFGAGSDLGAQALLGQRLDWSSVLASGTVGAATAGIGGTSTAAARSGVRSAMVGGATDAAADVTHQTLVGERPIDWSRVWVSAATGATTGNVAHHLANPPSLPHRPPLGFATADDYRRFGAELRTGVEAAGYDDVSAIMHGSSVTGFRYGTTIPFDGGPTPSDFDVALASPTLLRDARDAGIELRSKRTRTGPLDGTDAGSLGLDELAETLSDSVGRKVSFMVYESHRGAMKRSPSHWIPGE